MEDIKAMSPSASRPSISFPLGIGLLVIMLLCVTAFFLCCLYWDRLRSLFHLSNPVPQPAGTGTADFDLSPQKPLRPHGVIAKQNEGQSVRPVLMPGDEVPKFVAMACPCKPPVLEKITVVVHRPSPSQNFCALVDTLIL